jgi:RNA polymerase sigma-70 factor (ECF subfamily)
VQRQLVERAQRGDHDAFETLAGAAIGRLDTAARLVLRDPDWAKDAVQETLVRAWRNLPGLRDPDRFDAWLHRLVVRACLHEAVRQRRLVANLRLLPADHPAGSDDFLSVADRDQLERGFRRLDPQQRAILVLRHFAGFEPAETADLLGVPAGTARSRLHHAHRAMRAALEADARPALSGSRPS